jgi:hypothetical protein
MRGIQRKLSSVPNLRWAVALYIAAAMSGAGCSSVWAFPGGTTQLLGVGSALAFLVVTVLALFYLATSWTRSRLLSSLPLLVSLSLAWLSFGSGRSFKNWWFNNIRLRDYEAGVTWVESQAVPLAQPTDASWTPPFIELPPQLASLAFATEAHRHSDGSLIVTFVYSRAFPVKHFAYLYTSSGKWDHHLDDRWHGVRVAPKWFTVCD